MYAIVGSTRGRWTGEAFRFPVSGASVSNRNGNNADKTWETLPSMEMVRRRAAAAVVVG